MPDDLIVASAENERQMPDGSWSIYSITRCEYCGGDEWESCPEFHQHFTRGYVSGYLSGRHVSKP